MAEKESCWEFKKCGRESGGKNVEHLGVCPAAQSGEGGGEGVNGGDCRGRICWAVTGTFCGDEKQGIFAQKKISCLNCPFFNVVEEEEGSEFRLLLPGQTYHRDIRKKRSRTTASAQNKGFLFLFYQYNISSFYFRG